MDDTYATAWSDAARQRRRQEVNARIAELYRRATAAINAGDLLAAEAMLVEAKDLTGELQATRDTRTWHRWTNAHR